MSYYLIYATEGMYEGLHGVCDEAIVETDNEKEVEETAYQMSMEIMESYSEIGEALLEDARLEAEFKGIESEEDPEFEEILNEIYEENVSYDYWKLKEGLTLGEYEEKLSELGAEELGRLYGI